MNLHQLTRSLWPNKTEINREMRINNNKISSFKFKDKHTYDCGSDT